MFKSKLFLCIIECEVTAEVYLRFRKRSILMRSRFRKVSYLT